MNRTNSSKGKRKHSSHWQWPLAAVVLALVVVGILELTNTIHLFHNSKPTSQVIVKAGNPVPAASNDSSKGSTTDKTSTANTNSNIGGVQDTNGTGSATTSPSQWITSASGAITVKQPVANGTIQNGSTLSGSATVSQVDYTLIDNDVGVVSEGTLNVVNGNFSGILHFTPHASGGRLDVYSTATFGGPEENEIEITVSF